jgi:glycosyltransferase involved in cell wall biosynthesis
MRVAMKRKATVIHAHWVIPGGVMAMLGRRGLPMVVSLHGSDVFVAERVGLAGRAAHTVFDRAGWVTACSDDLAARAISLGARRDRIETVPYGVDTRRFAPDPAARQQVRAQFGIGDHPLVFSAGRLVRKKGFEHLIDAVAGAQRDTPNLRLIIAGDGDLRHELAQRARASLLASQIELIGNQSQDDVARLAAAADIVAVPSVHDEAGNVDGLPNFALEALASATPVVATNVGGLPQAIDDGVTGRLVPERDPQALARVIGELLASPPTARQLGLAARFKVERDFGWARVAERFEAAYVKARAV